MGNDNPRPCPDLGSVNPRDFLGKPWTPEYNCWSMVRDWYSRAGEEVPEVAMNPESLRSVIRAGESPESYTGWEKTERPEAGDVACMTHSRKGVVSHVGIYVPGGIIHNLQGHGVVFTQPQRLSLFGLQTVGYWYWRKRNGSDYRRG